MTAFGWALAGGAALAAAFAVGALAAERGLPRLVRYLATVERDAARAQRQARELAAELDDAIEAIGEYREAIPKVWDRGFEAGQHVAEFQLARAQVEQAERSRARWN